MSAKSSESKRVTVVALDDQSILAKATSLDKLIEALDKGKSTTIYQAPNGHYQVSADGRTLAETLEGLRIIAPTLRAGRYEVCGIRLRQADIEVFGETLRRHASVLSPVLSRTVSAERAKSSSSLSGAFKQACYELGQLHPSPSTAVIVTITVGTSTKRIEATADDLPTTPPGRKPKLVNVDNLSIWDDDDDDGNAESDEGDES